MKKSTSKKQEQQQQEWIELKGVRENNLKNFDIKIPKNKITVVTGLSGSGKSSLVFETLFLESQRRFLDGLSNYSKNFIDTFKKPELDALKGVSPSIAVDQKTAGTSPRSTVGTITEVLDFLRLLYARLGVPTCPNHDTEVRSLTSDEIFEWAKTNLNNKKVRVVAPVVQGIKGEFKKEFTKWESLGFIKARVNGEWSETSEPQNLQKRKSHYIDLLVDQFLLNDKMLFRLRKAIRRSLELTENFVVFEIIDSKSKKEERKLFSLTAACPECGFSFPKLEPRHFSFNNPQGACVSCGGLGTQDIHERVEDDRVGSGGMYMNMTKTVYDQLTEEDEDLSDCSECKGSRLNERARSVSFYDKSLADLCDMSIYDLSDFFSSLKLDPSDSLVGEPIFKEVIERLKYLKSVGTGYLSLNRRSETLSGGERQRLRLACQLGSPLVGVLYVLDEPSIGLHPKDHNNLLSVIKSLCDQGNTIVIVEHDEDTMRAADYLIEIGPGAGRQGGELVKVGDYQDFLKSKTKSITTDYLLRNKSIHREKYIQIKESKDIVLKGAGKNNLKDVTVSIPSSGMTGVSGVSGSGKSSLIMDTLSVFAESNKLKEVESIEGLDQFKKISRIDQKPIGKTPRSVPGTYVGVYQIIRDLYTRMPESQLRGFKAGHFSFNSNLGRCSECEGLGVKKMGSHFLASIKVSCGSCGGLRFKPEVLSVRFKEKNIAEVLDMSLKEAYEFFENQPSIKRKLKTMLDVGLGYIKLGQDSTTLSGGESQRLKLSKELSKSFRGKVLYILDEPTTGLHFQDIQNLLNLLSELVAKGHAVIIIEHHLDLLRECDHLIELGPGGGVQGGEIVDFGKPLDVAKRKKGPTGEALDSLINS